MISPSSDDTGETSVGPGQIGPGAEATTPPVFSCDESAVPEALPLPRLSRSELENTFKAAIQLALPAEAETIWTSVADVFARVSSDERVPAPGDLKGGYGRADQSIQQARVDSIYAVTKAIAEAMTESPERVASLLGGCADRACLEAFVERWGGRVLRTELSAEDIAFFADVAADTPLEPSALADVIIVILNAPQTLYFVEHGSDDTASPAPLSSFELASRLSYQFLDGPPDDELWQAASDSSLLDPAVYERQVDRLLQLPALEASLEQFVTEWLRLDELPVLDALRDNPAFIAFAGDALPPPNAGDVMIADVTASAVSTALSAGTLSDFLTDRHSYATDSYLAGIYQTPVWSGMGEAPLFTSQSRAGLLTRAAMLATGTPTTRPIHKGYLVRNALLCQQVGAPPANVNVTPPESAGDMTTREAVTQKTSVGVCGACHTTQINPPGFLTENFDALGRERSEERIFDAQGNLVATLPINTVAAPRITPSDEQPMADAIELTMAINQSRLFHSCFARHYFRFSERRYESTPADSCALAALEAKARSGAPMTEVMKAIALAQAFQTRRFQ